MVNTFEGEGLSFTPEDLGYDASYAWQVGDAVFVPSSDEDGGDAEDIYTIRQLDCDEAFGVIARLIFVEQKVRQNNA